MSALTAARTAVANKGPILSTIGYKAAASQTFYNGAMVAKNTAGYLVPAATTAGLTVVGVCDLDNQNSLVTDGVAGSSSVKVKSGIFAMVNGSSTDAVTIADLEELVYVLDDQTISRLPGAGRPVAGILKKLEGGVPYVAMGHGAASPNVNPAGAGTAWQGTGSVDAVGAPGAIPVTTHITELTVDGTDAHTLADGLFIGQEKVITVVAGTNTPVSTVTPATPNGFANVTALGALGDCVVLVWTADGWSLKSHAGVTVA